MVEIVLQRVAVVRFHRFLASPLLARFFLFAALTPTEPAEHKADATSTAVVTGGFSASHVASRYPRFRGADAADKVRGVDDGTRTRGRRD